MSLDRRPNPYENETDEAIIEVFARADDEVLLTKEIWPELSIGKKQTRRRLRALEEQGILASRETTQDIVWWLDEEVEEPITVRYPLLRFVRRRFDVQAILAGIALGAVGGLLVLLYVVLLAYEVAPPVVTVGSVLMAGMYAIVIGVGAVCGGLVSVLSGHVFDRLRGQ
jgi:uncharacterized MnhB-related membrane protein